MLPSLVLLSSAATELSDSPPNTPPLISGLSLFLLVLFVLRLLPPLSVLLLHLVVPPLLVS